MCERHKQEVLLFFYGPLGEVVKNIRTIIIPQHNDQTFETQWSYDTWNRLESMVYPDGEEVTYNYNVGGLLNSMTGKKKGSTFNYVQQLGYDEFEQRVYLEYGNGTKTTYNYEPDRRRLKTMTASTSKNRAFMDNVYTYDKVNNILGLKNNAAVPASNLMGGSSDYAYEYDDLYRLTSATGSYKGANEEHSYTLSMEYNTVGGITRKNQQHLSKEQVQKKTSYDMAYEYTGAQPHAPNHIGDQTFAYDANGNQTGWRSDISGQRRDLLWDACPSVVQRRRKENRIRAISDNGAIYHYVYDASGTRVLLARPKRCEGGKGQSNGQSIYVDGKYKTGSGNMPATPKAWGNYTVYVNPYIVLKRGGYTKHFYIEGQRIVSKLGGGLDSNGNEVKAGLGGINYSKKHDELFEGIVRNLKWLADDGSILTAGKSGKVPPGQVLDAIPGGSGAENFQYYYHPDHLGSTSYITDASGEVYQHLEYFAFGETFVEEHSNTDRTPYLFNGKELDEETGLYYYGARYYDPVTSIWQSVDPLAGQFVNISPYAYALNNPLNLVDLDGWKATGPPTETKVGKFFRNYMPGIVAAPLGGLTDAFAGVAKLVGGAFKGDKAMRQQAGRDILGGTLSIFGLKEVFMDNSKSQSPTSMSSLPNSLNSEVKEMQRRAWTDVKEPQKNGMHAWHAGTNAALSNKLGPIGGVLAWLVGVYHETPFDKASFMAEQRAQGTVNHIYDSFTDLIANTAGMTIGLILPKKWAKSVSLKIGNLIPGPGDPDPHGIGTGGYNGRPKDAWGQWPGSNKKETK